MRKHRNKKIIVAILLTAAIAGTSTIAYMFNKTPEIENKFAPGEVKCSVDESFDGDQKISIKVTNTGNTSAYIRVNFATHWQDKDGKVVGQFIEMPALDHSSNWIQKGNTYYYKFPVAKGAATEELLNTPLTLQTKTVEEKELFQVVDVFGEAIQSKPESAVEGSWKVELDTSGNIKIVKDILER